MTIGDLSFSRMKISWERVCFITARNAQAHKAGAAPIFGFYWWPLVARIMRLMQLQTSSFEVYWWPLIAKPRRLRSFRIFLLPLLHRGSCLEQIKPSVFVYEWLSFKAPRCLSLTVGVESHNSGEHNFIRRH